ncbi:hypothetical protein GO003_024945 [Methylicorpusculum oleiharenae]|uniref:hypothetical protein n=1 Tax=Methylicorpusculum oleiharenae TaxID=1338687 RepID=UPI0013597E20|nr:hypothetical protein [Methylicorpusculum oleiharenae]MCD2453630.1 hypothetical protein [Methylicorpusculum oleiharenae]
MKRILTPDQAIAYFSIVLDELSIDPFNESSVFCSEYINLDFAGIAMPAIQIDPPLTYEQRALIGQLCDKNRSSQKYRFAKLLRHFRHKISNYLNSKNLQDAHYAWRRDPLNVGLDFSLSPRGIAEMRFLKRVRRASNNSIPGIVGKSYTEYLNGVFARI